jgi:hypothetical protein
MTVEGYDHLPKRDDVIDLALLLEERSGPAWSVVIELPFRTVPQYDLRGVEVGVVATEQWDAFGEGGLFGSPEIVIEVLAPSNRRKDIVDKMALSVDRTRKTISMTDLENKTRVYKMNGEVPFAVLGTSLKVSEILKD